VNQTKQPTHSLMRELGMHPSTWRALIRRIDAMQKQAARAQLGPLPLLRAREDRCLSCGARIPTNRRHRCALCSEAAAYVLHRLRETL
jgi:hypothetical protein